MFRFSGCGMAHGGYVSDALRLLAAKGLRYATVMDLGCADGHFFLMHLKDGFFSGAVPVNIDANPFYEESLKAIREVVGGSYVIGAVSDHVGEVEMTMASHPYWSSLLGESDPYWERMNQLHAGKVRVDAVTIDWLRERLGLKPPFLLKLDVQGSEIAVLNGARETLKETDVVVCEIDLADFPALDRMMDETGFSLFDMTELRRMTDGSLSWFYPVYLNRRRDGIRSRTLWDASSNDAIIEAQRKRRNDVLEFNARVLSELGKPRRQN
jgi:FkbM family methyltransferase